MLIMWQLRNAARSYSTHRATQLSRTSVIRKTSRIQSIIPHTHTTSSQRGILSMVHAQQRHHQQQQQTHGNKIIHSNNLFQWMTFTAIASSTLLYNFTQYTSSSSIQSTLCEESKPNPNEKVNHSNLGDETQGEEEVDEPTTCTICLINRQGPCRKHWRRFERCIKESPKESEKEKDKESSSTSTSTSNSTSEKCDQFMIPWITCVQSHRNLYTYLSNKVFQDQYLSELEDSIPDTTESRIHLDGLDLSTFVTMGIGLDGQIKEDGKGKDSEDGKEEDPKDTEEKKKDWYSVMMGKDGSNDDTIKTEVEEIQEEDEDFMLVENSIKINLYDFQNTNQDTSNNDGGNATTSATTTTQTALPITIAYIKDQDGNLLGYEEFNDWKTARRAQQEEQSSSDKSDQEGEDSQQKSADGASASTTVGQCIFSMIPQKTTAIQFYALYESDVVPPPVSSSKDDSDRDDSEKKIDSNVEEGGESTSNKSIRASVTQRLYYSSLIPLDQIPHDSSS